MAQSDPLCFPFTKPGLLRNTRGYFSAKMIMEQLEDREEQVTENCMELEL